MARALSGRRSTPEPEPVPEPPVSVLGKGRATPRRRDVENARRSRARVPQGRKEASIARRSRMREERELQAEAMRTGDERHMPARDKGPVKRFVRDTVDSRRHVAEYFLPITLVALLVGTVIAASRPALAALPNYVLLVVVVIVAVDSLLTSRRLRRGITERFGADEVKGNLFYGVLRSTQFRRIRQPKPQVVPGATV